jgi:hypothetical protein
MTGGRFGRAGGKPHLISENSWVPSSSRRITGARSVGQMSPCGWRFGISSGHLTGVWVRENAAR